MPETGWSLNRERGVHLDPEGNEFVTCTTALKLAGIIDFKFGGSQFKTNRGTAVHDEIEGLLTKPVAEIEEAFGRLKGMEGEGPFAAFLKFRREVQFEVLLDGEGLPLVERKIWHPAGFAGKLDCAAKINGFPAILDFKTGQPALFHGPQLCGYLFGLWGEDPPEDVRRYGLYLRGDGSYKLKGYEDEDDFEVFLSAVAVARWKLKNGVTT